MDAKKLTPYLRRRVLNLSVTDRAVLASLIAQSLREPTLNAELGRMEALNDALYQMTGVDCTIRGRTAQMVEARTVLVYVLRMEGFTQTAIADFLNLDHSTICHLERRMRFAFELPAAYPAAIDLYNRFTKAILK